MRFSTSAFALCTLFASSILAPVQTAPTKFAKRAVAASDILVLKFADVLEQLESQFYQQALAKFQDADFVAAGFPSSQVPVEQFQVIQNDEATHSSALQSILKSLNEPPITTCKFKFDDALKDVATMAAVARVVEAVGVGAYLGAAPLVTDPVLLTAAASIVTVEARHQTILNILSNNGSAIPAAFDIVLKATEVLTLASPFIDGPCDVGIQANPPLTITTNWTLCPGTKLTFSSPALNSTNQDNAFCQMLVGGQPTSIALPLNNCVIPEGINGPVAIFITSDGQPLINNVRDRATSQLIAGPTLGFIDTKPEVLGQLAKLDVTNPTPITSTSTITLTPADASVMASQATPTTTLASTDASSAASQATPATTLTLADASAVDSQATPTTTSTSY